MSQDKKRLVLELYVENDSFTDDKGFTNEFVKLSTIVMGVPLALVPKGEKNSFTNKILLNYVKAQGQIIDE